MKKSFRSAISLILTVILLFGTISMVAAKESVTPVVVVSGMNSFPLTNAQGETVYPPSGDKITSLVTDNIKPLLGFLVTGDWQKLGDEIIYDVYEDLFTEIVCDENGNSVNEIKTSIFPESVDNYPDVFENGEQTEDEIGIVKGLIKDLGGENVYFFNYDWRLDPMKHADDLNAYIEKVKAEKNCEKVTLIPCSMGGTVTNSYLYKYGSDSVNKVIYAMTAIQGLDAVGEVFHRNIDVNVDVLMAYLFSMQRDDLAMQILMSAIATFTEITLAITKWMDNFIDVSLEELNDRVYDELMVISFGTLPGFWALVPDSYYDDAKEIFFDGKINKTFEKVIDNYHYNVQARADKVMQSAIDNGTEVYVLASYGYVGGPYTGAAMNQSDCLIETANQSGWATTALYGESFGKDYQALGTVCADKSHNHVSTDGIIDASTCFFPENTWFIKYNKHVGVPCDTDCQKLMTYLVTSEEYVTVHSDESFPQFTSYDKNTGKLTSLTGSEIKSDISSGKSAFFIRLVEIIKSIYINIKLLFAK